MTGEEIVRETLARYRERASVGLDITFPIYWQMDLDLGKAIGRDLGAHGVWEMMQATPGLGDRLPAYPGLYMFVFRSHLEMALTNDTKHRPTWVLYVGQAGKDGGSGTIKNRYSHEYAKYISGDLEQLWGSEVVRTRAAALKRYLTIWPLEYWWLVIEDKTKIGLLEDRLIKLFAPPLNRVGRLKLKTGETKPAFEDPK